MTTATLPNVTRHTITPDLRPWWEAERDKTLGASEVSAALGMDEFCTPIELWLKKTGRVPKSPPSDAMKLGLDLEPIIARRYEAETGVPITETQVWLRHEARPLSATLDGIDAEGRLVEFKTIGERRADRVLGMPGTDEVPPEWVMQAHQQMLLAEQEAVTFQVLIGGQRWAQYRVTRSEGLMGQLVAGAEVFWGHVERNEPPGYLHADARLVAAIWEPSDETFEADEPFRDAVNLFEELRELKGQTEKQLDDLKAQMLTVMQGRIARLADGRRVKLSTTEVREHVVRASRQQRFTILKARG